MNTIAAVLARARLSLGLYLTISPAGTTEPSTGMDPMNKRFMWDVITRICTRQGDCSVVLTTHSMEECEALCTRCGIMVGGRLRCLGSIQDLKNKFGGGYQLDLKLADASKTRAQEICAIKFPSLVKISRAELQQACSNLGDAARAEMITESNDVGWFIWSSLETKGFVHAEDFCLWWLVQDLAAGLIQFIDGRFPGARLIERHDLQFRFNIPLARGEGLAQLFKTVEQAQQQLSISEYALSQTTLEQIFNQFAAQQEEETGTVRGLQ